MKNILAIRLSAMGDVAMAVPVVRLLLHQYPEVSVTFLSAPFLAPFFAGIDRCTFVPVDTKGRHNGIAGLFRLFREVNDGQQIDVVADLHDVLRTKILRGFFLMSGTKVAAINKGRSAKKALTRKHNKILRQLPTSHKRYAEVFARLGFPVDLHASPEQSLSQFTAPVMLLPTDKFKIGIAPFAQHAEKMVPIKKMKEVVQLLAANSKNQIYLLGARGAEANVLESWIALGNNVLNLAGKQSLAEELKIMQSLNLVVSMDSANLHMASMAGVPVVSVWGATHRFAGFYGWQQPVENIVETDLYCRPCSVFGNKPCYRGDHACMQEISPEQIVRKITAIGERLAK